MAGSPATAQGVGKYLAPRDQVVAIRAGKLFDARNGTLLANQVIVVRGDRIADVGAGVEIPAGATRDRSRHRHRDARHDRRARARQHRRRQRMAAARACARSPTRRSISTPASPPCSTWIRAAASTPSTCATRSTPATCRARACRWSASRSTRAPPTTIRTSSRARYYQGYAENKNVNGPWLARAAVREAKLHGVDYIKIYTTQDFAGTDAHVAAGRHAGQLARR